MLLLCQANAFAVVIDLGDAADFAVLGLDGADVTISSEATTVTGDVGIGPNNTGDLLKATINGTLFVDPTASPNIHGDLNVTGGQLAQDLTQASDDALAASLAAAALTSTQTFGDITDSTAITADQICNVILLNSLDLVKETLTLSGGADDFFLFNVTNGFSLNGSLIVLDGGLTSDHVLFNFSETGTGDVDIFKDTSIAYGTFLAPNRDVTLDKATLYGAILSGGKIVVHSGAQLTFTPFTPPPPPPPPEIPEPASLMLMGLGLAGLGFGHRRKKTRTI